MKKLYIGNLSFKTSEADLEAAIGPFGAVRNVSIVRDRDTGQSRGFGFAEMDNDAEAQAAINGLNGTDLDGRALTVNEARPQAPRSGGGGGGGRGRGRGGGDRGDRGDRW